MDSVIFRDLVGLVGLISQVKRRHKITFSLSCFFWILIHNGEGGVFTLLI